MYKRNSKILAALLTIVMVFSIIPSLRVNAAASGTCGAQGDNLTWTLDDAGTLTISGTGAMADYEFLHQTPWYSDMSNVTSIVISDGVTAIGDYAFWGCNKASSVKIGSTVESIGEYSFSECSSIKSITLPESVQSIAPAAFMECTGLESINIPAGVTKIEGSTFYSCSNLKSITIPDGVTTIGLHAFTKCTSLESIEIPASVISYDSYSFMDCTNLKNVTFADGSTIIGEREFYNCTSLKNITIPDSVTKIGVLAFTGCTSLESITIPDSVTSIDDWAFSYCTSLTNVTMTQILYDSIDPTVVFEGISPTFNLIPSGYCGDPSVNGGKDVTWIFDDTTGTLTISGTGATAGNSIGSDSSGNVYSSAPWFAYKDSLTKIIIKNGVTSIGESNFAYLSNVVDVTIPNSVTSIGNGAFHRCTSLTGINIPDSITTIGSSAFTGCTNLTNITIPNSVTSIGNGAFADCTSLTSITIPDSVTSIGFGAFSGCTSLTSITIPDSVISIGNGAFYNCTSLTSITIPDSVISIGMGAFGNCTNLTSITIPDSVQDIGDYAFEDCTSLTDVTMSKTLYDKLVPKNNLGDVFSGITLPSFHFYYTVDYKSNGNGTISGTTTKSFGTDQIELTIQPDSNYELDKIEWSDGTNSGVLTESTGKYTMPDTEAGAVTLTATFKLDQKTVTFKTEDGTVLQSGFVDCGTNPIYKGTTPAKAEDDKYTSTFAGWSDGTKTYGPTDTLPVVTDDATYTAVFDSTVKQYTIKFVDEDGTVLQSGDFNYGTTPSYTGSTPTKAEDDDYTYAFAGWTPAIVSVTGNTTYTATFTATAKPAPVTKPGTYYLSSMEEQDGKLVITIKMNEDDSKTFDLLGSISSDGVLLTEGKEYARAKGSLIITLQKSFLDTLAAGNHKLTVTFTDGGSITIDYVVKAPATASVPATGEAISTASVLGCIILATAGITFAVARKRKEEV